MESYLVILLKVKDQSIKLSQSLGNEILISVGKEKINQLDRLENDFNYAPS